MSDDKNTKPDKSISISIESDQGGVQSSNQGGTNDFSEQGGQTTNVVFTPPKTKPK